ARFVLEMQPGDIVLTPPVDTEWLHFGRVAPEPSYYLASGDDGCPYRQRRRVVWSKERINRGQLSVPLQNTLRSSLTVYAVSQIDEILTALGEAPRVQATTAPAYDPYSVVLEQVLQLD